MNANYQLAETLRRLANHVETNPEPVTGVTLAFRDGWAWMFDYYAPNAWSGYRKNPNTLEALMGDGL